MNGLSSYVFKMIKRNDSIFILRHNNSYTYFGRFEKESDFFITHLGFYIAYKPNHGLGFAFEKGSDYELQSYEQRFFKDGWFELPIDMTNPGDTIAWCNVYYSFQKIQ